MKVAVCVEPDALGDPARAALACAAGLAPREAIVAIGAGSGRRTGGLKQAIELGAGRAVHVTDPALGRGGSAALGAALARAARRLGCDLVLAGTASPREGRGVVPAFVADALNAPIVSRADAIEPDPGDPGSVVVRLRAGGARVRLVLSLPAVITVAPRATVASGSGSGASGAPEPETATGTVETIAAGDLGPGVVRLPGATGPSDRADKRKPKAIVVVSADDLVARWLD